MASGIVIFGCGYLGSELARQAIDKGLRVTALTRNPETAAALVAFLASEDAAHINGEKVRVDGGTLA